MKFFENKKNIIFRLAVITGLVFYLSSLPAFAQANPSAGLQVSPTRLDWDMNSGEERTGYINLKNYSDREMPVEISVEDFYVTDDSTQARFFVPDATHPLFAYDVINWVDISKSITLAPGEGKDIGFHMKIPEGSPTGGYYGAVFFKTSADNDNLAAGGENSQIRVNYRVGVLLTMAVKGEQAISKKGDLKKFEALKKIFWSNPVKFLAEVTNSGNLHYKLSGSIEIFKFGKKIAEINLDPRLAYPGKTRTYKEEWKFTPWSYGFYRAKINLVSEDQAIKLAGSATFCVIPWKTTLALILLVVAIRLIYRWFGARFEIRKKGEEKNDV